MKTIKEFEEDFCKNCPNHKEDLCGYVKRGLERKCQYLSNVSYGYELALNEIPNWEGVSETTADTMCKLYCIMSGKPIINDGYLYKDGFRISIEEIDKLPRGKYDDEI